MTDDQMPAKPAETAVSATEAAAEGTEHGEAVERPTGLREVVLEAVELQLAYNTMLISISDEGLQRIADAVTSERDGLRRKLDAVRALCELDDLRLRDTVGAYAIDLAVELRKILDGEA